MSIKIDEILKKITEFEDKNLNFSALTLWEKVLEKESTEFYLFRYADILRLCGFFSKAEAVFISISVDKIPAKNQYTYFLYLGQIYKDQGRFEEAKVAFLKSVDLNSDSTVPYVFLSSVLINEKDTDEAIKYLKIALTKDGDIDEVNYNLARRLSIKGEMQSALDAINACLKISRDFPDAVDFKNDLINFFKVRQVEID